MRQHVRDILKTLKPRERKIIQYRFGMHENKQKTLSEIGDIYGLSNERIRQLESRALNKLKEWCLTTQGLKAYRDLLVWSYLSSTSIPSHQIYLLYCILSVICSNPLHVHNLLYIMRKSWMAFKLIICLRYYLLPLVGVFQQRNRSCAVIWIFCK